MIGIYLADVFSLWLLETVYNIIGLFIRIVVGLTLYASAKYNKFSAPILWAIFGLIIPFWTTVAFYLIYRNKAKNELFCTINEPCFKEVMK